MTDEMGSCVLTGVVGMMLELRHWLQCEKGYFRTGL